MGLPLAQLSRRFGGAASDFRRNDAHGGDAIRRRIQPRRRERNLPDMPVRVELLPHRLQTVQRYFKQHQEVRWPNRIQKHSASNVTERLLQEGALC